MREAWTQWEGHLINGEFHLQKYLGGSDQSGVFLTQYRGEELQQAAIKLVPADSVSSVLLLSRWRLAEGLSHPHLLKVLHKGHCRLDATDMVFLVTEYAEENLAQIVPERPLTPSEVEQMLEPVLDALAYLHNQGLAHSGLNPANIMAAGNQLKLSSDSLSKAGESIGDHGKSGVYDPPEKGREGASPSGDVWSLGITLVEVLTQRVPSSQEAGHVDLALPKDLPAALSDIVRGCLHPDPAQRWTIASILERLHPQAQSQVQPAPPVTLEPQAQKLVAAAQTSTNRRLPVTLIITLLAVAAILVTVGLSLHDRISRQNAPDEKVESKPKANQAETPAPKAADKPSPTSVPAATPVPAARRSSGEDEVVEDVLPKISEAARDSIQGTVRVNVRVQVDSSGNVVESEFDSPGPSQYFARMAMDAAKKWRFTQAGDNARREFVLHFEFRNSGVKAFVKSPAR